MIDIKHGQNCLSRYATGRAWKGAIQRAVVKTVAEKIKYITDELQRYTIIRELLFGEELDVGVQLNDGEYTLGSSFSMLGDQTTGSDGSRLSIWEFILDLTGNGTVEERIDAIVSALINSGSISASALEDALRNAGFDVYVHPNTNFIPGGASTLSMTNNLGGILPAGGEVRLTFDTGIVDPDIPNSTLCVNFIDEDKDESLYRANLTTDPLKWKFTFFIGGFNKLDFADVDEYRKSVFREIILKTKPASMWAVLLINYV